MNRVPAVPLAWHNLAHDRVRFGLFSAGVGFAVVLMGVQLGIMNAMLDGNTLLLQRLNGDLVLVNPGRPALLFPIGFNRRRLEQAEAVAGVAAVAPIYLEYQLGELRHTASDPGARSQTRPLRVVGVDPASRSIDLPHLDAGSWAKLSNPGAALYDRRSRAAAHPRVHGETVFGSLLPGTATELAGRRISLVGGFDLGFDFSTDGTLVLGVDTFSRIVREPYDPLTPLAEVDLGVVRVRAGEDVGRVRDRLREAIGGDGDVAVLTKAEMVDREKHFWWTNTPIGFAFGAGVVLGFVVGMVICYQILSTDVADHQAEYATLKAIGYTNRYLSSIVLQESLLLAAAGFVPGLLVTYGAYVFLSYLTGLPLHLTPGRVGLVLALTVTMCMASGLLAVDKAKKVDPADVF